MAKLGADKNFPDKLYPNVIFLKQLFNYLAIHHTIGLNKSGEIRWPSYRLMDGSESTAAVNKK